MTQNEKQILFWGQMRVEKEWAWKLAKIKGRCKWRNCIEFGGLQTCGGSGMGDIETHLFRHQDPFDPAHPARRR